MNLLKHNGTTLTNYYTFLGLPVDWPFTPAGTYAYPNPLLTPILDGYLANYIAQFNALPVAAPICNPLEKHPYLDANPIDYARRFLIIGTFPPFSYFANNVIGNGITRLLNTYNNPLGGLPAIMPIPFFYGNVGSFWNYLPGWGAMPVTPANCIAWLTANNTSITDIIKYCQRRDLRDTSDSGLYNIIPNYELMASITQPNSRIETLVFTSGKPNNNYLNNNNNSTFSLYIKTLIEMGIPFGFSNWGGVAPILPVIGGGPIAPIVNKALFTMNINGRNFNVVLLPSPSGSASRSMDNHPFASNFRLNTPVGLPLLTPPALRNGQGWTIRFRRDIYNSTFIGDFATLNQLQ